MLFAWKPPCLVYSIDEPVSGDSSPLIHMRTVAGAPAKLIELDVIRTSSSPSGNVPISGLPYMPTVPSKTCTRPSLRNRMPKPSEALTNLFFSVAPNTTAAQSGES